MYRLATKRAEKNESKKTRTRVFLETDNQACTGCVTFCYFQYSWTKLTELWSVAHAQWSRL